MNRCFFTQDLQDPTLSSYEDIRAKAIHEILGPKGKSKVDVILDLQGESTVYPIFINEAAYYEKGIAMCLTEKQQVTV